MTSSLLRPMITISHKSNPKNFKLLSFKSKNPSQIHNSTTNPIKPISSNTPSMEVELKLRLPNSTTHKNLLSLLSPFHTKTHLQENIFFDTATAAFAARRAALRLRFYNHDRRCVLSLKSNPAISGGVSRIEELEHDVEPLLGRACVGEPWRLARLVRPNRVLERLGEMGFDDGDGLGGLVCLGGFRNVRNVFEWKGLTLEVDETIYEFGVCYEMECESDKVDEAKELIEEFLKSNGIDYSYSRSNKFAIFRSGKLPVV